MDAIKTCAVFLTTHIGYWALFFFIFLVFIGQAIYAYFRLDRPEIINEFTPLEIEMTRMRIYKYLANDLIVASLLFLLLALSIVLKLAFMLGWI